MLAEFFAPHVRQYSEGSREDYITRFVYDHNWWGGDNWNNIMNFPLTAYVYFSMVESEDYHFLFYSFFHPRDWCSIYLFSEIRCPIDQHENDLEGVMIVVDRLVTNPTWPYGEPVLVETIYHKDIHQFRNCTFTGGYTVTPLIHDKGCMKFESGRSHNLAFAPDPAVRAVVWIETKGHGVVADPSAASFCLTCEDYYYFYYPSGTTAQQPSSPNQNAILTYRLTYMHNELVPFGVEPSGQWQERLTGDPTYQELCGDSIGPFDVCYGYRYEAVDNGPGEPDGAEAKAPWGWDDGDDLFVRRGDFHNHPWWSLCQRWSGPFWWFCSEMDRQDIEVYNGFYNPYICDASVDEDPWNTWCAGGAGGNASVAPINLPSLTTALTKGGKNRHMADLTLADGPAWARPVRVLTSKKSSLTASVETGTQEPVERRREFSWDDGTELARWSVKDVVTGQSRRVSTTAVRDALWGYPEDKALVARIPGNVVLTSPVLDANSLYSTVVLRYRTLIPDLRLRIQWRTAAMPGDALTEGVWIALEGPSEDFRLLKFEIPDVAEGNTATAVRQLVMTIMGGKGPGSALEVDYILFWY